MMSSSLFNSSKVAQNLRKVFLNYLPDSENRTGKNYKFSCGRASLTQYKNCINKILTFHFFMTKYPT